MRRAVLLAATVALAGCGRYADFTLPLLPGGDPNLTFALDEHPEPVLTAAGDALNPSVVDHRGLTNLYSVFDGNAWSTAVATSSDGMHWQPQGIAIAPDDHTWESSYIAANGSALADGNSVSYWYVAGKRNAGRIGLARMTAGSHAWQKEAQAVLAPGPFDSWDERAVADPYAIRIGAFLYMYYLGHDRADPPRQRLGIARSTDSIHWEKLRANPILEPGQPGSFDEAGVGEPAVWQSHGFYWMLFTGRDFSERRRLGLARSTDGVHWKKLPTVFSGASAWDSKVICDPTVIVNINRIDVWFGGGDVASPDENLHGKIGYATLRPVRNPEAQ